MECGLAITRNPVLVCVTMWVNLKNIMLGEISWNLKDTYLMLPFIWNNQKRHIHKRQDRGSGLPGPGAGGRLGKGCLTSADYYLEGVTWFGTR